MAGNSFGTLFKITTCGESHGGAIAVIVDGCPPGFMLSEEEIQKELDRRKPGKNALSSPREEKDRIHILSGVFEGKTIGTPILMLAYNQDMKPEDYSQLQSVYRPSHADYTYEKKYGFRDFRGGGRASARETLARVAAGAIAKKYLKEYLNIEILSYVEQIGSFKTFVDPNQVSYSAIENSVLRCPDEKMTASMLSWVKKVREEGDSTGGIIKGVIKNVPIGLGEPVFDKLSADLGKAMLSINAVKGFEIGSGFESVHLKGSEHNDRFVKEGDQVRTQTNFSGGILGGISNGEPIEFRVAFKPVASIAKMQTTLTTQHKPVELKIEGRHDACVVPRAVPIVDAMAALVIMDHWLRHVAQCGNS